MGVFNWPLRISNLDGGHSRDIEATVDTGATYTMLPTALLRELGITAMDKRGFELADGRIVEMDIGEARATINGSSVVTLIVFGDDGAPPLLGAYTLEGMGLAVDPVQRRLVPTNAILY